MKKVLYASVLLISFYINIFALTSKEEEFFKAVKENKYEAQLKNILRYKIDLNATNERGLTPLLYAIECGNERAVRVLLEYSEVNIEYKLPDDFADYPYINRYEGDSFNIGGATPLMFAIFKGNARIVKQLIDKNANVKARDNEGTSVFLYACGFGDGNIIRMLLVRDRTLVNNKTPNSNINGLHYAASLNNLETINFLIKNVDMNINDRDLNGCTALYYAAYHGKKEAYNLLIKLGANKDIGDNYGVKPEYILSGGSSAVDLGDDNNEENNNSLTNTYEENMYIARIIETSDTNALRNIMMYSNFNMNSVITAYETPLTYAIHLGKDDIVNQLFRYKMYNTNIINIETTFIPRGEVYFDESTNGIEAVGNVYLGDASPLQYAIFKGNTNIINTLLKLGADINRKDSLGNNALMYAASYGSAEVIDTLLNYSSNSYRVVDIYGDTPLHNAAALGNTNTLTALMNRTPININAQNIDGNTPLHFAVKNHNSNTYRFLLLKGADYTIKNYDGKTASDLLYADGIESIESIISNDTNSFTNIYTNDKLNKINTNNTNLNDTNNYIEYTNSINQSNNMSTNYSSESLPYDDIEYTNSINNENTFDNVKAVNANTFADDLIYEYSDEGITEDNSDDYVEPDTDDDYSEYYNASQPLFEAIYNNNVSDVLKAVSNGININSRNEEGFTPLLYAINYDRLEVMKALLSYSNIIDIEMPLNNYTNIYSIKGKNFSGEVLFNGTTPLQYAIYKGNTNAVNLLIENGADTKKKDYNGYCSLFYASAFSDANMIHFLLKKDPSLTREKSLSGRTVMHFAALYGNDEAISYYLSNTFLSINAKDNEGNTPLHCACEKGYSSTIDLLVQRGAKTDIKNNEGLTPADITS
ncbi:ankyrin repeat domain-containing protein [Brachyspira innocens]|uniref:Ankyrin repeat domain-containing protein n=1 Tax=Brachyspira innocens TaxID=13264 RepID=A0ABT8YX00_9SPIR|nr:ankyrin repeat domain-containing protein [Brachyspira innocens]MDO6992644.1 ankyrin repeat domain-containing protein [Brachyspira innocens]MDO7020423.1 ankyrin repeat domain-containing protein [Brachyspira innocens]